MSVVSRRFLSSARGHLLRERCLCPKCVNPATGQRWSDVMRLPREAFDIVEDTSEGVVFGDGHRVVAHLEAKKDWARSALQFAADASAPPAPKAWSAETTLRVVDAASPCYETLLTDGCCIVEGVDPVEGEVLQWVKREGFLPVETAWGLIFNVTSQPDGELQDNAYTSEAIEFHTDGPYTESNTPHWQLLHCLVNEATGGESLVVDGLAAALALRSDDAAAFQWLVDTPVRFENDNGSLMVAPILSELPDGSLQIRYSAKSGGYAPPNAPVAFFEAKRKFFNYLQRPEFVRRHRLSAGQVLVVDNWRILHSRTAFDASSGARRLQGMYMDGVARRCRRQISSSSPVATFAALDAATKEQIEEQTRLYAADWRANGGGRLIELLRLQNSPATRLGSSVTLYEHALQAATRALRAQERDDVVVAALLHDVGELFSPSNHGSVAAALLAPYVDQETTWVLEHHEVFQGKYYFEHLNLDPNRYRQFEGQPHFEACERFCSRYDCPSFDPDFDTLPLSAFLPALKRVLAREPFWHTPNHPKAGAVTGQKQ